jgi:hypothetical protein
MGLLDAILGNATEVDIAKTQADMAQVLVEGEQIQVAFKVVRDLYLFTDKRLLLVDKQGITGKKTEFRSLPYKSITQFSLETAGGIFDEDADLKIWISGQAAPMQKKLSKKVNFMHLQQVLAWYVLGGR